MNSRDRYEIVGLREISHSIKQPCRSVCLKIRTHELSCLLLHKKLTHEIYSNTHSVH